MNLRTRYRQWVTYFETVSELKRCSDRSLADLGIERHDIREIARSKTMAS